MVYVYIYHQLEFSLLTRSECSQNFIAGDLIVRPLLPPISALNLFLAEKIPVETLSIEILMLVFIFS